MVARAMALQDPLQGVSVEHAEGIEDEPIGVGGEVDERLDDDERRALSAAIAESLEQATAGLVVPAARVLEQLRHRRG